MCVADSCKVRKGAFRFLEFDNGSGNTELLQESRLSWICYGVWVCLSACVIVCIFVPFAFRNATVGIALARCNTHSDL